MKISAIFPRFLGIIGTHNILGFPTSCSKSLGCVCNGAGNAAGPARMSSGSGSVIGSDLMEEGVCGSKALDNGPPGRSRRVLLESEEP